MATQAVKLIRAPAQAAALLDPLRVRIVEQLAQPNSATGLSKVLRLPRQRVNYHLRALEKAGLVEPVEERRKGNCVERIVRATARSYLISPDALGDLAADPARVPDKLSSAYQVAVAARAIRDLAVLQRRADKAGMKLATLTIQAEVRFASAAARNAFSEELAQATAALAAKYHDVSAPEGRLFKYYLGAYPAITKDEAGNEFKPSSRGDEP